MNSFYRGNDCTINCSRKLKEICSKIFESGEQVNNLILTKEQNEYYDKQDKCHICLKEFNNLVMMIKKNDNYEKVKNYCHFSGKFKGAAHKICSLRYVIPHDIPVLFHNGSNY